MATTQEVSENVKQAREQALVGNYEESRVYYTGAIQGVQQLLKVTPEPDKKQKWKQVYFPRSHCTSHCAYVNL